MIRLYKAENTEWRGSLTGRKNKVFAILTHLYGSLTNNVNNVIVTVIIAGCSRATAAIVLRVCVNMSHYL